MRGAPFPLALPTFAEPAFRELFQLRRANDGIAHLFVIDGNQSAEEDPNQQLAVVLCEADVCGAG